MSINFFPNIFMFDDEGDTPVVEEDGEETTEEVVEEETEEETTEE